MSPMLRGRLRAGLLLLVCAIFLAGLLSAALPVFAPAGQIALAAPPDPTADIPWSGGHAGVADVQSAFNHARTVENSQLGTHLPMLSLPAQSQWSAMSDGQRALWLINRERSDRGLQPMYGLDPNVSAVAQAYAQYLLDHNEFSHNAGGHDPGWRLAQDPKIAACMRGWLENLYASMTTAGSVPLPLEQALYAWLYDDGSCCGWGHRHNVLTTMYTNGPASGKGLLGIGHSSGGPYQNFPHGEVIVMDAINPCPTWVYPSLNLNRHIYLPALRRQ